MKKAYFNSKRRKKEPNVENERRRLNNESIEKSISGGMPSKRNGKTPWNKKRTTR